VGQAWVLYASGKHDDAVRIAREAISRKGDCEGAYYLLGRALFAAGRYQEVADMADAALEIGGDDYNVYVPIENSLNALGKGETLRKVSQRLVVALENHLQKVPEDARARIHLAGEYATLGRADDAIRETNLAIVLRPNEASVQYNAACVFCTLNMKTEAMDAIRKAWDNGMREAAWARRDPELAPLHGDPEFERLYPEATEESDPPVTPTST